MLVARHPLVLARAELLIVVIRLARAVRVEALPHRPCAIFEDFGCVLHARAAGVGAVGDGVIRRLVDDDPCDQREDDDRGDEADEVCSDDGPRLAGVLEERGATDHVADRVSVGGPAIAKLLLGVVAVFLDRIETEDLELPHEACDQVGECDERDRQERSTNDG